ncbi:MAG: hypothetical protein ACRD8O_15075 [Bryobacteraceae bacterium]
MIAVSLLAMLSIGILMSMRLGLNAMSKTNQTLMANRRVLGAQRILDQQIAGFMPVVAWFSPKPESPLAPIPFFQGEPESMRFVSSYSMYEGTRGAPRILEFQVIPGDRGRGVRLVVNEHPYTGPLSAGNFCLGERRFRPIQAGGGSFVLADRLAECRFSYQESQPPPVLAIWRTLWTIPRWPRAIRVEMIPLDADPSRLRPVTVTARVHVDRYPIFEYVDF